MNWSAADEGPHPTSSAEEWTFSFWAVDGALGAIVLLRLLPGEALLVLVGPRPQGRRSCTSPTGRRRCHGLGPAWPCARRGCGRTTSARRRSSSGRWPTRRTPSLSTIRTTRRAYGVTAPIALDVEWYATGPPSALVDGYEQQGEVHGTIEPGGGLELDGLPAHRSHRWGDDLAVPPAEPAVAHLGLRAPPACPTARWSTSRSPPTAGAPCNAPPDESRDMSETRAVESITLAGNGAASRRGRPRAVRAFGWSGHHLDLVVHGQERDPRPGRHRRARRFAGPGRAGMAEWSDDGRSAIYAAAAPAHVLGPALRRGLRRRLDLPLHRHAVRRRSGRRGGYAAALRSTIHPVPSSTTRRARRTSLAGSSGRPWAGARPGCALMQDELFGLLGITSADPRFDAAGTFIGSSFLYCTARTRPLRGALPGRRREWRRLLPDGGRLRPIPAPVPVEEEFGHEPTGGCGTGTASPGRSGVGWLRGSVHHRAAGSRSGRGPTRQDNHRGPPTGHRAPPGAARPALVTATKI